MVSNSSSWQFPLTDLDQKKSQEFLEYFRANLMQKTDSPFQSGSARFNEKNEYETYLDDFLKGDEFSLAITWKIIQKENGVIPYIEVIPESNDIPKEKWQGYAQSFIAETITAAFSEKKQKFFQRFYYSFLGPNLSGEYWLPGFRFAPLFPNDEFPHLVNAERIFVIDLDVHAIDLLHANKLGYEKAERYSSYISFLLNIGLSKPDKQQQRWVLFHDEQKNELESKRYQFGFLDKNIPKVMPEKGELCPIGEMNSKSVWDKIRYAGELISCPKETRKIIRAIENSSPSKRNAFDRCAKLYQVALTVGRHYPTIQMAYMVASVESIAKAENQYNKSFSEFMRRHCPSIDNQFLNYLYSSVRSGHFHSGEFPLDDAVSGYDHLTNPDKHKRFNINRYGHEYLRSAILDWIMSEIVK